MFLVDDREAGCVLFAILVVAGAFVTVDADAVGVLQHVGRTATARLAVFIFDARRVFVAQIGARQRAFVSALCPHFVALAFRF